MPESSLIAVYFRQQPLQSQIRLDMLALNRYDASDIAIALDISPGGSTRLPAGDHTGLEWDMLISIPAGQMPTAIRANGSPAEAFRPRVQINPAMEMVVVSWNHASLGVSGSQIHFQVFVYPAGNQTVASFSPILSRGQANPSPAPLLLAFWNALPAATPAQALRRWDGAHTGPVGQRHGLNILLSRASEYNIPVALLDLRQPKSLSALEYMRHARQVKQGIVAQQVIAPNTAFGDPDLADLSLRTNQTFSATLDWLASPFTFAPIPLEAVKSGQSYFSDLPDRQHIVEWRGARLIPLPDSPYQGNPASPQDQINSTGLTISLKQALLAAALSADPTDLVVAGGALNQSLWAEDSITPLAFNYIAAHPWINPLDAPHLLAFPALEILDLPFTACTDLLCTPPAPEMTLTTSLGSPIPSGLTSAGLMATFQNALTALPENVYTQNALETYLNLTSASSDPALAQLKTGYLPHVGTLIFAAQWAQSPTRLSASNLDVDWDGMPEVVIASENFILIAEPEDGRILLTGSTSAQWIAPSSQFAVGLGSPADWRFGFGESSDPQVIRGGLADVTPPSEPYLVSLEPDSVTFSHRSGIEKTFRLTDKGLMIKVESSQPIQVTIPLVLALDAVLPSRWATFMQPSCRSESCVVPTSTGELLITSSASTLSIKSCLDSASFITTSEIPDRSYPPGHFLPFPLMVAEFSAYTMLDISISEVQK